jgi:hypothetical protein
VAQAVSVHVRAVRWLRRLVNNTVVKAMTRLRSVVYNTVGRALRWALAVSVYGIRFAHHDSGG